MRAEGRTGTYGGFTNVTAYPQAPRGRRRGGVRPPRYRGGVLEVGAVHRLEDAPRTSPEGRRRRGPRRKEPATAARHRRRARPTTVHLQRESTRWRPAEVKIRDVVLGKAARGRRAERARSRAPARRNRQLRWPDLTARWTSTGAGCWGTASSTRRSARARRSLGTCATAGRRRRGDLAVAGRERGFDRPSTFHSVRVGRMLYRARARLLPGAWGRQRGIVRRRG